MSDVWEYKVGPHGATVTVKERRKGGNVYLYAWDPQLGGNRKRSLGFKIRDAQGRLRSSAVEKAKKEAAEASNHILQSEGWDGHKPVTLAEVERRFRVEVMPDHSDAHRSDTNRALEFWRKCLGPNFTLSNLGLREWNAARRERETGKRDARGRVVRDATDRQPVGPRTVAKTLKVLRHLCRFATKTRRDNGDYLLESDPTRGFSLPQEKNPRRVTCDDQTYQALLSVAESVPMARVERDPPRSYLWELLVLAAHTGRRIGSIVALRYSDWFPNRGTYGSLRWRSDADKMGYESVVPVTPEVRDAVERVRRDRPGVGDAFMFPAPRSDGHIRVDVTRRWLRKAEKLAGIEHVSGFGWHAFRRMWTTKRKHLPGVDVAAAGGWKDTQTIERCYQTEDTETMERVVLEGRDLRLSSGEN